MANAQAMLNEGLWRKDRDFQRLPRLAQCTFCQVLSQKDLDTAGVLTLHLDLLAKACDELTVDQLRQDFSVLEGARFLFVDYDTDEILVRSYVRLVSAKVGSKGKSLAWHSVPKNARMLASAKLRHELAVELRRIRWKDADALADEIDPSDSPLKPPSKPLASPFENGSPLQAPSKPHRQVQVLALESPSVVGSVGEEPPPRCTKHLNHEDPPPCHGCRKAREANEAWHAGDLDRRRQARQAAALARQSAIDACQLCDEFGDITFDNSVGKCTHQEAM